jgi:heme O synthase-like polyprenyltransferase
MVAYTVALLGMTLLLYATGAVGGIYLFFAVVAGIAFFVGTWALRDHRDAAMRYFIYSNVYLSVIFIAIAVDVLVLG